MRQRAHRPHGPAFLGRALSFEEVAENRHLGCGLYNICLLVAVRRGWPSFSCLPCSLWPQGRGLPCLAGPATVLPMPIANRQ